MDYIPQSTCLVHLDVILAQQASSRSRWSFSSHTMAGGSCSGINRSPFQTESQMQTLWDVQAPEPGVLLDLQHHWYYVLPEELRKYNITGPVQSHNRKSTLKVIEDQVPLPEKLRRNLSSCSLQVWQLVLFLFPLKISYYNKHHASQVRMDHHPQLAELLLFLIYRKPNHYKTSETSEELLYTHKWNALPEPECLVHTEWKEGNRLHGDQS